MNHSGKLFLLLLLPLLLSCKKRLERPYWDTEIVAPLVKTSLGIDDLNSDSLKTNPDNSLSLVFREELYSFGLDSLVGLKIAPFQQRKTLEELKLDTDSLSRTVTLGEIARQMRDNGDPMGDFILSNHGNSTFVPNTSGITAGPFDIDISDFFKSAVINTGTLSITIENEFPFDIENLNIELSNKTGGDVVIQQSFPSLPRNGGVASAEQDLAGKSVEGTLEINVNNMDIRGGFMEIDTNDALTATLVVKDLTVTEATAVFPAQNVIDEAVDNTLEDMGEVMLTKAIIKSGKLTLYAECTAPDTVYFVFSVPGASKDGIPFLAADKMNPAPPGGVSTKTAEYDFSGYEVDLTGQNHDTVNTIFNHLTARIEYTGKEVTFSLSDYIDIDLQFQNLQPSYVEGFLGRDTIKLGPETADFDVFNTINVSKLNFRDVKLELEIENGLGVDARLETDQLSASNNTETKTILNAASGDVARALSPPLTPVTSYIEVAGTNPGPVDLLNLLPDQVGFEGTVYINPNGNPTLRNDFAYDISQLKAYLNVELPLDFIAETLVLTDTGTLETETVSSPVENGEFSILAYNGFPLKGSVKAVFLDQTGSPVDSLISAQEIEAAPVDPVTGRTTGKQFSKLSFFLDKARIDKMLGSKMVIFTVSFSTAPADTHVKIYSDYIIDFKITGDFEYRVK